MPRGRRRGYVKRNAPTFGIRQINGLFRERAPFYGFTRLPDCSYGYSRDFIAAASAPSSFFFCFLLMDSFCRPMVRNVSLDDAAALFLPLISREWIFFFFFVAYAGFLSAAADFSNGHCRGAIDFSLAECGAGKEVFWRDFFGKGIRCTCHRGGFKKKGRE